MAEKEFRVKHGLVIDTLDGFNNEIVSLDANGKLVNSGVDVTTIATSGDIESVAYGTFGVAVDGGGSAISGASSLGYWIAPCDGDIVSWTILGDAVGSCVVDVKKVTYGDFPSFVSIAGTEKPTLSSAQNNQDTNLTTWTKPFLQNDVFEFVLDSVSTLQRINVIIRYRKG